MSDNSSSQRVAPGLSPQIIQSKIYQKNSKKTVLFLSFY
jgi:PiT family inorganic phosphate transporter